MPTALDAGRLPLHLTSMPVPPDVAIYGCPWTLADDEIEDLHRHDALEIGICHEGSGIFLIDERVLRFRAGSVLVIDPSEFHRARSDPGTASRWTFCFIDPRRVVGPAVADAPRARRVGGPHAGRRFPNLIDPGQHPAVCQLAQLLSDEALGRRDDDVLLGLMWSLLAALARMPGSRPERVERSPVERLAPALDLLGKDPSTSMRPLAARCRLSEAAFRRAFRQAMGVSPKRYAIRLRVERACALIRGGSGVLEAALACGFAAPSSLNRHCRAIYGLSPRALGH